MLSPLDRDILFLVFAGKDLSADHRRPLGERYQLAGQCLPATRVRALQIGGFIRSTGTVNDVEGFEITAQGRMALTADGRPSSARLMLPNVACERLQPPML
jgi:hypothetical protein